MAPAGPTTDLQARVAVLETEMSHLTEQVNDMADKVNAMHQILTKAAGAKWAAGAAISLLLFFAGGDLLKFLKGVLKGWLQ